MARIKLVPLGEGWNAPLLNTIPLKKVEMVDAELLHLGEGWDGAYPGNSVGVAIPQPRVAGEARYPGYQSHQS